MDFSVLILTIGIPGSGKTTWVKQYQKQHANGTYVISTDRIRQELTGHEQCIDPTQNPMIHEEARKRAKLLIENAKNLRLCNGTWPVIIIDSTNVEVEEWLAYKELGATLMLAKIFDVEPKEAIQRMDNRERKVPLEILEMKWKTLETNREKIPKIFNMIVNFL